MLITHVANRGTGTVKATNTASWTVTTTGAVAAGNSLVVFHSYIPSANYLTQYATITGTGFPALTTGTNDRSTSIASSMGVYYCPDGLASGTTLTITYYYSTGIATTTSAAAVSLHEFSGIANDTWESSNGTTGSSSTPSTNVTTVTSGNMVIGVVAVNGPSGDSFTQDTDTTNGSWVDVTTTGTTGAGATSNATVRGAWKITTASGTQTYNPTLGTSRAWATSILSIKADPKTIVSSTVTADSTVFGTAKSTLTGDSNVKNTISSTVAADAYTKLTTAASLTADSTVQLPPPTWVSPANGTSVVSTTPLVWTSVASATTAGFHVQLDSTSSAFAAATDYYSSSSSGFEYWDGSAWVTLTSSGMPANKTGNQVRFTPPLTSINATRYRRVRQSY